MLEQKDNRLSPTVAKVLDEYLAALRADGDIDDESAERLDTFLRKGKVPKAEDIETSLFPSEEGDRQ